MNKLINYLSILAGRKFHTAYHNDHTNRKAEGWLNIYIGLRQMLPTVHSWRGKANHLGNHYGSSYKPWKATQGI